MTVALVLAFAAWGQAGDLPWGSGLYRIRPDGAQATGRNGTSSPSASGSARYGWPAVMHQDGDKVVVPQTRQKSVRPWGEVPLEWQDEEDLSGGGPRFRGDDAFRR